VCTDLWVCSVLHGTAEISGKTVHVLFYVQGEQCKSPQLIKKNILVFIFGTFLLRGGGDFLSIGLAKLVFIHI